MHLRSANTRDLLASLEIGELDLALVEGPYDRSSFDGSVLSTEPYVAVASPRKAQSAHALSDLLVHPIIVREKGSGTREILERMLAAQGLELGDFASVIEVASIPVIKEFVRAGRGITFIYRVAVSEELSRGELVDLTPADCAAHHDFTLILATGQRLCRIPTARCLMNGAAICSDASKRFWREAQNGPRMSPSRGRANAMLHQELGNRQACIAPYSTVTLLARLRGWSTSQSRMMATSRARSWSGTVAVMGQNASRTGGM